MNSKTVVRRVMISGCLCLIFAVTATHAAAAIWVLKPCFTADEVIQLLNGKGTSNHAPVAAARVALVKQGPHNDFLVAYKPGQPGKGGGWGWKKSTTVNDVLNFLNGHAPYQHPVANAEIAAVSTGTSVEFFIFYLRGSSNVPAKWGSKNSNNPDDVMKFLNGSAPYTHPASTARIVGVGTGQPGFVIFYQQTSAEGTIFNWGWKKFTTASGTQQFINNGQPPQSKPPADFEISAVLDGSMAEIFTFYNQGTRLWMESPLANERFVVNEPLDLKALISSHLPIDGSQLHWISSLAGTLGSGFNVHLSNGLPVGNQNIQASALSLSQTVAVRVFTDLEALYKAEPSAGELARINAAFSLNYLDGTQADERWSAFDPPSFNQSSTRPSKLVVLARLDIMRHQAFSQPLPFGDALSLHEHFRKYVSKINLRLDCNFADGGGGIVELNRLGSEWWNLIQADCKTPASNPPLAAYIDPIYLLVHEERHNEPNDPGHTSCNGQTNMDTTLDNGSGHAWAALYTMWVYKYGLYDSAAMKQEAKSVASSLLRTRFCTKPSSANPAVQAIITELLQ